MQQLGSFLFRWRGLIFPLVIAALAVAFPPRLADSTWDLLGIATGLALVLLGQALRALTIGWDYIERGGNRGKVSASRLVTGGMYAYCRNPMYVGNFLMVAGFLLVFGRLFAGVVGVACCSLIYSAIAACEEAYLQGKFGAEFSQYRASVPRWGIRLRPLFHDLTIRALDVKTILLREYSTFSVTALSALTLTFWRAKGEVWGAGELASLSAASGIVLGFYLTMRYLKTRRIVYVPR